MADSHAAETEAAPALSGVVPIIPTPFTADEQIDFGALDRAVEFAASSGLCAACLPAYASEFYKLSEAERKIVEALRARGVEEAEADAHQAEAERLRKQIAAAGCG